MSTEIIVSLISAAGGIAVGGISIGVSKSIISYRIEQLEKTVDKHNNVVERIAIVERDLETALKAIDENKTELRELEQRI